MHASFLPSRLALDLGDLRPLQAKPGHQPFLAEDKGIDILCDGRGRQRFRDPGIYDDNTGADADLEALAFVEIPERLVGHEEQRVLKISHTGLQAIRNSNNAIIADRPAALP
jgi:hypothetical protein